jgi:hypothetical protein
MPNIYGAAVAITVDAENSSYVTGYYSGDPTFGNHSITNRGSSDAFAVKYNSQGKACWAISAGGYAGDLGNGIAVDPLGRIYIAGDFFSTNITIGGIVITNAGPTSSGRIRGDAFLARLAPPIQLAPALDGLQFQLLVSGAAGRALTLQTSTDFASWTTFTNFTGTGLTDVLFVPPQTEIRKRFFRATVP